MAILTKDELLCSLDNMVADMDITLGIEAATARLNVIESHQTLREGNQRLRKAMWRVQKDNEKLRGLLKASLLHIDSGIDFYYLREYFLLVEKAEELKRDILEVLPPVVEEDA